MGWLTWPWPDHHSVTRRLPSRNTFLRATSCDLPTLWADHAFQVHLSGSPMATAEVLIPSACPQEAPSAWEIDSRASGPWPSPSTCMSLSKTLREIHVFPVTAWFSWFKRDSSIFTAGKLSTFIFLPDPLEIYAFINTKQMWHLKDRRPRF